MKIRTFSKLLALLLALLMAISCFSGCAVQKEQEQEGESESEQGTESNQDTESEKEPESTQKPTNGQNKPSVGVQYEYVNDDRHLIFVLTDGTEIDMGLVSSNRETKIVTFDLNYDTPDRITTITIISGSKVHAPSVTMRDGYALIGWSTDAAGANRFDFSKPVTQNLTLYACWTNELTYAQVSQAKLDELSNIRDLNEGTLPEIVMDGESYAPSFINGTYSSTTVTDFDSAVSSLSSVQNIMGIEDAAQQYSDAGANTVGDTTQYRMQQTHNGYPVYGQQLIVTTNASGTVTSLSGGHAQINSTFNSTVSLSRDEAAAAADNAGYGPIAQGDGELVAYTLGGYNEMAYVFNDGAYTVLVGASDGEILMAFTNAITAMPSDGTFESTLGRQEMNDNDTFNTVWFDYTDEGKIDIFMFYDVSRNLVIHNASMEDHTDDFMAYYMMMPMMDADNIWDTDDDDKAAELYKNLTATYEFYLNVLGLNSYDGNGGQILAYINDGFDGGENAFANIGKLTNGNNVAFLSFGGVANYQNNIDVVAHEYTHALQSALIFDIEYHGQTGALMEAYADVMGELVQLSVTGATDWAHGERILYDPKSQTGGLGLIYPEKINGAGYYNGALDEGGVHHNSTVISHAIYTMYESGLNDVDELTELLYRAWGYLNPTATFYDYRMAMLAAAADMNMDATKIGYITSAFDAAGVVMTSYDEDTLSSVNVNCTVFGADGITPVPNAMVLVELLDENGTDVAQVVCDENGVCSINLGAGSFNFTVSATGYETVIDVYEFAPDMTTNLSFVLGRESNQEEPIVCEIGGEITHALTNEKLADVTLNFRKGYNVTSGRIDLMLTTDVDGRYYTNELDYGFYTIEIVKDGFITSYQTVQSAASNWEGAIRDEALNQSFSISPYIEVDDTLRIVLTWGETPRDLDSHLRGYNSEGSEFHVYYSNRDAYDIDSSQIANLDIDDTSSYGPETITIHFADQTERYRYYVHDFTNGGNSSSLAMSNSGAKVSVYSGNTLLAVYDVPTNQEGTVWHVFDFDPVTGQVISVNEPFTNESASSVGTLNTSN